MIDEEGQREPIENHLRLDPPLHDEVLLVRGGPFSVEKLMEHARRQQRRYSFGGRPMASLSVSATVGNWTLDRILSESLRTRSTYATCTAGQLLAAGLSCLPTHGTPHYDVLLGDSTDAEVGRFLAILGEIARNPYKDGTKRRKGQNGNGDVASGSSGHPL